MIRKEGFLDLDKELTKLGVDTTNVKTMIKSKYVESMYDLREKTTLLKIIYNEEIYYFKYSRFSLPYSELIANEIALDFGLPFVEYDLAILGNMKGVISKNYKKYNAFYVSGENLLSEFVDNFYENYDHNLENIWDALEYRYHNYLNKREIVEKLMNRVVSIFVFDILICQHDRHPANWEIEEFWDSNDIDICPIYDNEKMLSTSGTSAFVSMLMDNDKNLINNLNDFIRVSGDDFSNLIKDKIWIIETENLKSIFKRVEDKIGCPMPEDIKKYYLNEFNRHRKQLNKVLNNKQIERDENYARKNK